LNSYFRVLEKDGKFYPQMLQEGWFFNKWIYLSFYFGSDEPYPHSSHELAVRVVLSDIGCHMYANLKKEKS
jgi:hypothetical protein